MATATFSVRMDSKLKKNFKEICESFGLSVSSAINVFASAVVIQKKIPFSIVTKEIAEIENGISTFYDLKKDFQKKNKSDMTLEEINKVVYAKK